MITQGPFEAVGSTVRTKRTADGRGGIFVADCWRSWQDPGEFQFDGCEADDNAKLFAAAPELLEVARTVLSTARGDTPALLLSMAEDAIAKATR